MPKIKVSIGIGFANANHEDIIEIDQTEWDDCETEDSRSDLMQSYWSDWSNNYIDGYFELIDEVLDGD